MARKPMIICITEGKKPDIGILEKVTELFLAENTRIEFIGENIYSLYEEIQSNIDEIGDSDIDTFSVIKNRYQRNGEPFFDDVDRSDITATYLFFDFDGHDHRAKEGEQGVNKIQAMLEIFDNAQEKGSLFINYPMIEAYRDTITNKVKSIEITNIKNYKSMTGSSEQTIIDPRKWDLDVCIKIFNKHLSTANYLIFGDFCLIREKKVEDFSQLFILENQNEKFINPCKAIAVLSCLPLFLFEHRGKKFLEQCYPHQSP